MSVRYWDPRTKLLLVICISALALICSGLNFLLPLLLFSMICAFAVRRKGRGIAIKRLKSFFAFFVFIALMQSIFNPSGAVLLALGGVNLFTVGGLIAGAEFLCRILILMFSAVLISTEDSRIVIQGLIQWKMPYEIAFMTATAIHFIPIFVEEIKNALTAIQLRGVDIKRIPWKKRIKIYTYLFIPITGSMIVRAREMAIAMEMRAFRVAGSRSSYIRLQLRTRDCLAQILFAAVTVLIFILYIKVG